MEDREFFDLLYQHFAKTTGAENTYWMSEQAKDAAGNELPWFVVWAVGKDDHRHMVADNVLEEDADFITAVHGCFPDLVRRMHDALDESDRLDEDRDNQEVRIADLVCEIRDLEDQVSQLKWERGE